MSTRALFDKAFPQPLETVESLKAEVSQLRRALRDVTTHRPFYEDDETPDEYDKRVMWEMREMAACALNGQPIREYPHKAVKS
jgi:hypothetical protein